ncbi:hypothetical protein CNR22_08275 [Sphingobacteriaceae bacterium]|nr:hypothetical protein CNR22_08275 [Sphingobacteriaceae bacterium]
MKKLLCIVLFLLLSLPGLSFHIVGGEIIYNDLGNGKYEIILKIYRDCAALNASPFDGLSNTPPAYLTSYNAAGNVDTLYEMGSPLISSVPSAFNNACVYAPNDICIEEGIYTATLTLPPRSGGYTLVYQRCCRNAIISNLLLPATQGATYFTKIPGPEEVTANSSPRYTKFPPIYICDNVALRFDHSATDPDGDQLVYSLCAPYAGLDGCCASLNSSVPFSSSVCPSPPASCPTVASAPPYSTVMFVAPFSGGYPIASNPVFAINPTTGELTGTPTLTGQYVVGVCVQEYRNNVLLNTHFRDFQFTVIPCTVTVLSAVADQTQQCQGQTIYFKNQSLNNSTSPVYHWDFGVSGTNSDTSNLVSPNYLYPDTGIYTISLVTNPGRPCTDTLRKQVYVYPPLKIKFKQPDRQCFKGNAFTFTTQGDYLPQTTFDWNFTSSATPVTSNLKDPVGIHFNQPGVYFVKMRAKQFACRDSFTDSVRVIRSPKAKINTVQPGLCEPASVGFSNGTLSDIPVTYLWKFSDGTSSTEFEPLKIFTPAGTYAATLIAESKQICKDTSMVVLSPIVVNPSPVAAFSLSPKETSIFEPEITVKSLASADVVNLIFYFGDGQTSTAIQNLHSYSDFGDYRVTQLVTNQFGCSDSISDLVKILPEFRFWIPNSFTPDDNGRNDIFMPVTIGALNYDFEIFNRWGQRIFKTTNPEEGWNGSYKGLESPQGIYAWKITLKNVATQKSETHLGHVTLIRNP